MERDYFMLGASVTSSKNKRPRKQLNDYRLKHEPAANSIT